MALAYKQSSFVARTADVTNILTFKKSIKYVKNALKDKKFHKFSSDFPTPPVTPPCQTV